MKEINNIKDAKKVKLSSKYGMYMVTDDKYYSNTSSADVNKCMYDEFESDFEFVSVLQNLLFGDKDE